MWQANHRGELLIYVARRGGGDTPPGPDGGPANYVLLGVVDSVDCVAAGDDLHDDETGRVWVLANIRPFARPVPHAIRNLGLFQVADAWRRRVGGCAEVSGQWTHRRSWYSQGRPPF
jgi:hypothetical protein